MTQQLCQVFHAMRDMSTEDQYKMLRAYYEHKQNMLASEQELETLRRNIMEHLIDKILEADRLMREVDAEIRTCGVGGYSTPAWFIFDYEDYKKVLAIFNGEDTIEYHQYTNNYQHSFNYRGVLIYCLTNTKEA